MSATKAGPISSLVTRRRHVATKRILDTAAVVLTAPLTLPVALATAVAVRANLGSPVVFKQTRIGLDEEPFTLLKFRSMLPETDEEGNTRSPAERITKFGALLRESSMDELPQLWNVLRGDMSLVGPRPLLPEYLPHYTERERLRHSVRPGITGLAQTSGRNNLGWDERLALDVEYGKRGSLADDAKILFRTLARVFRSSGVVADPSTGGEYLNVHRSYPGTADHVLRRLEPSDAETRVRWMQDKRVSAHMNVPRGATVESTREWISGSRCPHRKDLVLVERAGGEPRAMVGIRGDGDLSFPELHVFVDPDAHSRGLGSLSMRLAIEWLRDTCGSRGCWLTVSPQNPAALAVYRRLGFKEAGVPDLPDRIRMELTW